MTPYPHRHRIWVCMLWILVSASAILAQSTQKTVGEIPVCADARLIVEPFAQSPDIVHPISLDFDRKGRLLVVESHTHFRPANYQGPKTDRVRILEDTDGDGKADRFTTFFEGTSSTMDLAVHPDGTIYLATRNEILRLPDQDGDGKADRSERIMFLETKGNYPHNGLSGLAFDSKGQLIFGMGENLGEPYRLIGSDGKVLTGGGEGGNVFHCDAQGKNLRRVATGFWNPFGTTRDVFGRYFVVDNDPDSSPPCRLLQLVPDADYGFQFRYGRAGRHVFQAWNGELPGCLPYAAGTGESPCEVISYESDGLPAEYRGDLLVPAWADHRLERYRLKPKGAALVADRMPFVQGGKEFRPSGLSVAPDGSLFMSDWVSSSYDLHGKGAVWHIKTKNTKPPTRWSDPAHAARSLDRQEREAAAWKLGETKEGVIELRQCLTSPDSRVRATALSALARIQDTGVDWAKLATADPEIGIRELAVKAMIDQAKEVSPWAQEKMPPSVRAIAFMGLNDDQARAICVARLGDDDPFLRHAAIARVGASDAILESLDAAKLDDPRQRTGLLLAWNSSVSPKKRTAVANFLQDPNREVRFLAIKTVSDHAWEESRPALEAMLQSPDLDHRTVIGLTTALARIAKLPVNEEALASSFLVRLKDKKVPTAMRVMALRGIPASQGKLTMAELQSLLAEKEPALTIEALRLIKDRGDKAAGPAVKKLLADASLPVPLRAQALLTLSSLGGLTPPELIDWAQKSPGELREEALRGLVKAPLSGAQKEALGKWAESQAESRELLERAIGKPRTEKRPAPSALDAWVSRFRGPGNAEAGRRIFEHPQLASCSKCHAVDGRGATVGPDLSLMGKTDRRWILESLTQPGNSVAPHFQSWVVETNDGKLRVGLLAGTHLDESVFVDQEGNRFKVQANDLASMTPRKESLMPDGLLEQLTDQEILDLLAFLESKK